MKNILNYIIFGICVAIAITLAGWVVMVSAWGQGFFFVDKDGELVPYEIVFRQAINHVGLGEGEGEGEAPPCPECPPVAPCPDCPSPTGTGETLFNRVVISVEGLQGEFEIPYSFLGEVNVIDGVAYLRFENPIVQRGPLDDPDSGPRNWSVEISQWFGVDAAKIDRAEFREIGFLLRGLRGDVLGYEWAVETDRTGWRHDAAWELVDRVED